jgi:hypothetical protein
MPFHEARLGSGIATGAALRNHPSLRNACGGQLQLPLANPSSMP